MLRVAALPTPRLRRRLPPALRQRAAMRTSLPHAPPRCQSVNFRKATLPRYLIERSVPGLSLDDVSAAGRRSVAVLAEMPEVRWIRSYVSDVDGKIYCEYDAPSVEAIREHARRAGLPVDRVSEIALEINPAMFV